MTSCCRIVQPLACVSLACALSLSASAQSHIEGDWAGPWSYEGYVDAAPLCNVIDEFAHAALIPTGTQKGKVLLWHWQFDVSTCMPTNTTTVWVLDPQNPTARIAVPSAGLSSDIFCGGQSADRNGKLVIAGGIPASSSSMPPREVYRFDPDALGLVVYDIATGKPYILGGIVGAPPPWTFLGNMTVGRYYPTIFPLHRDAIASNCTPGFQIAGGANMILGGPADLSFQIGNDLWEYATPGQTGIGPYVLFPAGGSAVPGWTPPSTNEAYALNPAPPITDAPTPRLDSYPRVLQMSNKDLLVANDVDTFASGGLNPPGKSTVMRTPLSSPSQCWEYHKGPNSAYVDPVEGAVTNDRYYGSAGLLHRLLANGGEDRLVVFGGSQKRLLPGVGYIVNKSVQEFRRAASPSLNPIADGEWSRPGSSPKADMQKRRVFCNAVILPDGQVLITGGDEIPAHTAPASPVFQPELYDIGQLPTATGSSRLMKASNAINSPVGGLSPTPRLYHHVAVLLPDGRVFIAGGEDPANGTLFPRAAYSGEVFYPHYLFQGFRPGLTDVPSRRNLGQTFTVTVSWKEGASHTLERFAFLRPAAVTHHFDNDQRYIERAVDNISNVTGVGTGTLTGTAQLTAPTPELGPPGFYLLFAVERGIGPGGTTLVPSEGLLIKLN